MSKSRCVCKTSVWFFVSFLLVISVTAEQRIVDENGVWHGLVNINPDTLDEPWMLGDIGKLSPEEIAEYNRLPEFEVPPELVNRTLPKTVDHSTEPQFRPVFTQKSMSCGQASGMGYHFTYERNCILGTLPTDKNNICAYAYTWNMINGGNEGGSLPSSGYMIAQANGCGHIPDFNNADDGGSTTAWMNGYAGYFKANDCHVTEIVKFESIDYNKFKQWFYDKGTGTGKNGGIITFGSSAKFTIGTVSSGPFAGQKLCTKMPDGTAHCMTLTGYSDEVSYDLNGDGIITDDVDITRDGVVDYRDRESGAVQLVNTYGTSFNNQGKVWVLISGFGGNNFASIKVEKYSPKLFVKAKITSSARNTIVMLTGYSSESNATIPMGTKKYGRAFNKSGGAFPMCGKGASPTIEVGLECTEFVSKLSQGTGTLFLQIEGTGTVDELSVMYHPTSKLDVFKEFKYSKTNVTISGTMNLGIPVSIDPTDLAPGTTMALPSRIPVQYVKQGTDYYFEVPHGFEGFMTLVDIRGKTVQSTKLHKNIARYAINRNVANGTYCMHVSSGRLFSNNRCVIYR